MSRELCRGTTARNRPCKNKKSAGDYCSKHKKQQTEVETPCDQPVIIETQEGYNCGVHAINNALQAKVLTRKDVVKEIENSYRKYNEKKEKKGKALLVWKEYLEQCSVGGLYPDHIKEALHKKGYKVHGFFVTPENNAFINKVLDDVGARTIAGFYKDADGNKLFDHSIGVHNGYLIESILTLSSKPYKMSEAANRYPENFTPNYVHTIYEEGSEPAYIIEQIAKNRPTQEVIEIE